MHESPCLSQMNPTLGEQQQFPGGSQNIKGDKFIFNQESSTPTHRSRIRHKISTGWARSDCSCLGVHCSGPQARSEVGLAPIDWGDPKHAVPIIKVNLGDESGLPQRGYKLKEMQVEKWQKKPNQNDTFSTLKNPFNFLGFWLFFF